jgi:5-methylcytosine-specific restriction protein A
MPKKPKRPCGAAGCSELVDGYYCEKHGKAGNAEYNRYRRDGEANGFYNGKAWRTLAKRQLQREPLCAECFKNGRVNTAVIADHVVPIKQGGARLDIDNLQSLCRACHNRKTGREKD